MLDFGCWFGAEADSCGTNTTSARAANGAHILDMLYGTPMMKMNPLGGPGLPAGPSVVVNEDGTEVTLDGARDQLPDGTLTASVAFLDVVRAKTHQVPGGIALARHVKSLGANIDVLSLGEMNTSPFGLPENSSAGDDVPLLYYLAHEAIEEHQGRRLGKLGSMIVCETILGLISATESHDESWTSTITGSNVVTFTDVADYIGWDWTEDAPSNLFN